jgi:O-methyltransferase
MRASVSLCEHDPVPESVARRVLQKLKVGLKPAEEVPAEESPFVEQTSPEDEEIIARASPYTMTSAARLQALIDAVRHCEVRGLDGAFAECGVWLGGSVLAMILTLQELGAERDIYLYDTFEGMTEPTEHDYSQIDSSALSIWNAAAANGERPWPEMFGPTVFNEGSVREMLAATGYPVSRLHFVRGPVEETIPGVVPGPLALLRLDTDWYASTRHELHHLYPLLVSGGSLIIDDYGHWDGARKAVDEYFRSEAEPVLLTRIDYTGRIAVKS